MVPQTHFNKDRRCCTISRVIFVVSSHCNDKCARRVSSNSLRLATSSCNHVWKYARAWRCWKFVRQQVWQSLHQHPRPFACAQTHPSPTTRTSGEAPRMRPHPSQGCGVSALSFGEAPKGRERVGTKAPDANCPRGGAAPPSSSVFTRIAFGGGSSRVSGSRLRRSASPCSNLGEAPEGGAPSLSLPNKSSKSEAPSRSIGEAPVDEAACSERDMAASEGRRKRREHRARAHVGTRRRESHKPEQKWQWIQCGACLWRWGAAVGAGR